MQRREQHLWAQGTDAKASGSQVQPKLSKPTICHRMSYTPIIAIIAVLLIGIAIAIFAMLWANRDGQFENLKSGAYVMFDEDEPLGEAQDQRFPESADRGAVDENEEK